MTRQAAPRHGDEKQFPSLIWFSLLLGFIAQVAFRLNLSVTGALLLYLIAAGFFIRSVGATDGEGGLGSVLNFKTASAGPLTNLLAPRWIDGLLIALLLLLAAFFRFYRFDSQPSSLWLDESLAGLNALEIIEGKNAPIWAMTPLDRWRPEWVKTSNLYLYYVVAIFKIFGTGYLGLKMVSLLPAVASVIAAYFLFRELSNTAIAFIAAFLVAVSQWHVTISRWGWDAVLMSFLQLLSYWLLIRGAKSGRRADFVISGGLMGLCLYTYVAAWIALAIAVLFLGARAAWRGQNLRARAGEFCLFAFPCLVVFAPLGAYYVGYPQDLTVRASEISLAKAVTEAQSFAPVWDNIAKHGLMFNYRGDSNSRHGFPDGPMLDFLTSISFVFGLAYYARHWRRLFQMFVLLWFVAGLQGGLLSDPSGSPHAYRTFMVAPAACFFAATAVYIFMSELRRCLAKNRYGNLTSLGLGIALLVGVTGENFWTIFLERPKSPEVWREEARDGGLPVKIASLRKEPALVIVDPLLLWKIVVANSWYLTYQPGKLFESPFVSGHLLWSGPIHGERPVTFIYSPVFLTMVRSLFPEVKSEVATSPAGDPLYGLITVSGADIRTRLESADVSRLASAISKVAQFYEQQAGADAEDGPRRQRLRDESNAAIAFARKLSRPE